MIQRTKFKLSVYALLFIIASILIGWGWSVSLAYQRDADRLADMSLLRVRWVDYYHLFATYELTDCSTDGQIDECRGDERHPFGAGDIVDPVNAGEFRYVVDVLTPETFAVRFTLERGVASLERGQYVMTPDGVKR